MQARQSASASSDPKRPSRSESLARPDRFPDQFGKRCWCMQINVCMHSRFCGAALGFLALIACGTAEKCDSGANWSSSELARAHPLGIPAGRPTITVGASLARREGALILSE
jgi:hypothetical protein